MPLPLVIFILLGLVYNFLNGFHDSSNIVATIIFSRALSPRMALWLTGAAEFCGPLVFGVAVAKTIGAGIISPQYVNTTILIPAILSAILWNLITWYFGIPCSSSHALIGGLIGAVWIGSGLKNIQPNGLLVTLLALFTSPLIGFAAGYLFTRLIYFLARNATLKINWWFKRAQILTGVLLALSHGANDGQKIMGVITLGLVASGSLSSFQIPQWVILLSAASIALGTASGGWRLIKTLGGRFYKIRPVNGFATQVSSAAVILSAALVGGPVSTTQVVSSAILGVGSAERINKVRWGVAENIVAAWFLTIPASAVLAALLYLLISRIL
ncbi:MAG TPA: inorganic phosphate transporter [Anaerolineales bacterium]